MSGCQLMFAEFNQFDRVMPVLHQEHPKSFNIIAKYFSIVDNMLSAS